jgi:Uncharacterized protein conserved in bacteria
MNELSIEDVQKNVIQMLREHHTVTISTRDETSVWSATVFYVSDQDMNLFFLSSEKSKHINHIHQNNEVSATIYKDQSDWEKIKGIQLSGVVDELEGFAREKAIDQYLEKYKFLKQVINEPTNKDEEKIGSQFISIPFFN